MDERIALNDGWVEPASREVHRGGALTRLRGKEAELLAYLAARHGHTVVRGELFEAVFGYHPDTRSRTLDTTVRRIRGAIEEDPASPRHLLTEVGVGYRFVPPAARGDAAEVFLVEGTRRLLAELGDRGLRVLCGPPGIGKSTWAHRLVADHGGQLARAPNGLPDVARALGLDAGDPAARLQSRIGAWLAAHPGLLVLDDTPEDLLEAALSWAEAPGVRLVLCQRVRPRRPEVTASPVPPLPEAAASALFLRRWRALGHDEARVDLKRLQGLPLAIELAASMADVIGLTALQEQLADTPADVLDAPGGAALEAALRASVATLPEATRAALGTLCLLGGPAPTDLAAEVAGVGPVATLLDHGLLLRDSRGWVAVPLAARVAAACPPGDAARVAAALDERCTAMLDPFMGPRADADAESLEALEPLLNAAGRCGRLGVRRAQAHLHVLRGDRAAGAEALLDPDGPVDPVLWARLSEVPPAERLAVLDQAPRGAATQAVRCQVLRHAGRLDEAVAIVPAPEETGIAVGEWAIQLAMTHRHRLAIHEALHWSERAARAFGAWPVLRRRAEGSMAECYTLLGQVDRASALFDGLLGAGLETRLEASIGLGIVALVRKDMGAVRHWAERVAQDAPRVRDVLGIGVYHHIALLNRELGQHDRARRAALTALELAASTSQAPYLEPRLRYMLASVLFDMGEISQALATIEGVDRYPLAGLLRAAALELLDDPRARGAWDAAVASEPPDRERHLIHSLAPGASPEVLQAARAFSQDTLDPALMESVDLLLSRDPSPPRATLSEGRMTQRLMSHRFTRTP